LIGLREFFTGSGLSDMDIYQVASIVGDMAIFLGAMVAGFAFMLPKGWRSPLGMLFLLIGSTIVVASLLHTPDGPTYSDSL
jgi:drug/metabolite transporter (DMT)-like permease